MILILSEHTDLTTNEVIDWLVFYNAKYLRLNAEEGSISNFDLQKKTFKIKTKNTIINSNDIKSFWYRRGGLSFNFSSYKSNSTALESYINGYLNKEYYFLQESVYKELKKKNYINSDLDNRINKLHVLLKAKESGLTIPISSICSTKKEIIEFFQKNDLSEIITKSINNGVSFWNDNINIEEYTSLIKFSDIRNVCNNFFPTLIQEKLEKKYEIRTFFLLDKTYSVAVFSQSNSNTIIDCRRTNIDKPHRVVPFQLPNEIINKLIQLMKNLELNSGSIDFIYTPNKGFVFLEINPIGQFAQVSYPANYYLEKEVANKLIKFNNE